MDLSLIIFPGKHFSAECKARAYLHRDGFCWLGDECKTSSFIDPQCPLSFNCITLIQGNGEVSYDLMEGSSVSKWVLALPILQENVFWREPRHITRSLYLFSCDKTSVQSSQEETAAVCHWPDSSCEQLLNLAHQNTHFQPLRVGNAFVLKAPDQEGNHMSFSSWTSLRRASTIHLECVRPCWQRN